MRLPLGPIALRRPLSRGVPFAWEESHLYKAIKVRKGSFYPPRQLVDLHFCAAAVSAAGSAASAVKKSSGINVLDCYYPAAFAQTEQWQKRKAFGALSRLFPYVVLHDPAFATGCERIFARQPLIQSCFSHTRFGVMNIHCFYKCRFCQAFFRMPPT